VASSVLHVDLELFLTTWFRRELALRPEAYCKNVSVVITEPSDPAKPFPARLLVIRWDGSSRTSALSAEASIGLSVLAGSKANPKDANDLVLMVQALAEKLPAVEQGNPVTDLRESTGPFAIAEQQDRARRYLTITLGVVGVPI
jgi:hypothetical protein